MIALIENDCKTDLSDMYLPSRAVLGRFVAVRLVTPQILDDLVELVDDALLLIWIACIGGVLDFRCEIPSPLAVTRSGRQSRTLRVLSRRSSSVVHGHPPPDWNRVAERDKNGFLVLKRVRHTL